MLKEIFFQSSMPRSGSTLFQSILDNNPKIYGTGTDGCLELLFGARANFSTSPEFKAQDSELMKKAFIERIKQFIGYLQGQTAICRSVYLAKYFGEKEAKPCGICDICISTND